MFVHSSQAVSQTMVLVVVNRAACALFLFEVSWMSILRSLEPTVVDVGFLRFILKLIAFPAEMSVGIV
jgi:hypothetical protein